VGLYYFGCGYSTLLYRRRFAFDKNTIHGAFLLYMATTGESAILVHSVLHLGRALGLRVCAEGVETSEQLRFLQAIGNGGIMLKPTLEWDHAMRPTEVERIMSEQTSQRLQTAIDDHPNVGDIRGAGLFVGIELVKDRSTKEPMTAENLIGWLSDELLRRGVICRADDRLEPVIQLSPPLSIPQEDIDFIVDNIADVLNEMAKR
jgi:hypothetical protein